MFNHSLNFFKSFKKSGDLLRVYRGAFEEAAKTKDPDIKIKAFDTVVHYCDDSPACRTDDSIKRNMVMYWTYNNLGDAWVAKNYVNPENDYDNYLQAIEYYKEAVKIARDDTEKINSLQRISAIYKRMEDTENVHRTQEVIVDSLSDEYKRLGYMRLVKNGDNLTKNTQWLEKALDYVTKEEVSFLSKCQNTLVICKMLLENYRKTQDKVNLKRVNRLLNKTVGITVLAMEDKAIAEKVRTKKLEWYGKVLEIVLYYSENDRKLKLQTIGKIAEDLDSSEEILADGQKYDREMMLAMLLH